MATPDAGMLIVRMPCSVCRQHADKTTAAQQSPGLSASSTYRRCQASMPELADLQSCAMLNVPC